MNDISNHNEPFYIGIDLGGTHMQVGVVNANNEIVGRARAKTNANQGIDPVIDRMLICIAEACNTAGIKQSKIAGICVGAPSPVDPETGWIFNAVNLRWRDLPLAEMMSQRLEGIPVTLDNDVNVAMWGEYKLGAAAATDATGKNQYKNLLGVWVGTGIGGGLILNGALHHGSFGTAGEFGQMKLYPYMGPAYTLVEQHGSRTFIVENIQRLIRANEKTILLDMVDNDIDAITISHIADAIKQGDNLAVNVTKHAAEVVGVTIANAVTLLSLDCVVLGGGVTEVVADQYLQWVHTAFAKNVFPDKCQACAMVVTKLKDNAGLLGAALLARERLAKP